MKKIDEIPNVVQFYAALNLIIYDDGHIGKFGLQPFVQLENARRIIPLSKNKFLVCNDRNMAFHLDDDLTPFLPGWRVSTDWNPHKNSDFPSFLTVYNRETKERGVYNLDTNFLNKTPDRADGNGFVNGNKIFQEFSNQLQAHRLPKGELLYQYDFQRLPKLDKSILKQGMSSFEIAGFFEKTLIGSFSDSSLLMFDTHKGEVLSYIKEGIPFGARKSRENRSKFEAICGNRYYQFDAQSKALTAKIDFQPQMSLLHDASESCRAWVEAGDDIIAITGRTLIAFNKIDNTINDFHRIKIKTREERFSTMIEHLQVHDNKIYVRDGIGQLRIFTNTRDSDDNFLKADGKLIKNYNLLFESADTEYTTRPTVAGKVLKANRSARPFIRILGAISRNLPK